MDHSSTHSKFSSSMSSLQISDVDSPDACGFVLTDSTIPMVTGYEHTDLLLSAPIKESQIPQPPRRVARGHGSHAPTHTTASPRILGTLSVVAITFFFGCAGPVGSEDAVSTAGPLVALIMYLVYPIVFTFPYGAVVAELCTTFPEDGGFPIAVKNAFGPFWGIQVGYWSWIGNIVSTAIYPTYLMNLMLYHFAMDMPSSVAQYFFKAGLAVLLSLPTFLGTRVVSTGGVAFLAVVSILTLVYIIWGFAAADSFDQLSQVRQQDTRYNSEMNVMENSGPTDIDWFSLLDTVFWNYDGVQMASVFGGQVLIPARVYPRAISITIALTVFCYVLPIPVTVASNHVDWTVLGDYNTYAETATAIGGQTLHIIMIIVNFVSLIGMSVSSVFCESTEIAGMATSGLLPPALGRRSGRFDSPFTSALFTVGFILILVALDTEFLLPVTNAFASLVVITIFAAGIQLRRRFPYFARPATVPGGPYVLAGIAFIPVGVCGVMIVRTLIDSLSSLFTVVGFLVPGVLYSILRSYQESKSAQGQLVM
ncbi:hypothetical protein Poli38472_004968 [Pythium oligandrum]|uniref:Amino acid transporter n=1 Tax=Pythium oligandrum TaxID=41045 RepID=A0A8K1CBA6_PYTOL|nr:hypothetical protein Poli38472_004968 [Pythium oligandrum]|eukprot:TMW59899.1 hypothetical protein Poli38472_004968 [Pythium oligandrum]